MYSLMKKLKRDKQVANIMNTNTSTALYLFVFNTRRDNCRHGHLIFVIRCLLTARSGAVFVLSSDSNVKSQLFYWILIITGTFLFLFCS